MWRPRRLITVLLKVFICPSKSFSKEDVSRHDERLGGRSSVAQELGPRNKCFLKANVAGKWVGNRTQEEHTEKTY